jgi:hypothetical protein
MKVRKKWIMPIVSTVLVGAMIGFGIYGCKKQEPQEEDFTSTESVEQETHKEDTSPTEPVSLGNVNKIAFASDRDGNHEIYVMNADGSKQKRLTNNPARDRWPCWSPILLSENTIK